MGFWDQTRLGKLASALFSLVFLYFFYTVALGSFSIKPGPQSLLVSALFGIAALALAYNAIYGLANLYASRQIEIKLEKNEYAIGEEIKGTVFLRISGAKESRGIKAAFAGYQKQGKRTVEIFRYEKQLQPARTLSGNDVIPFAIIVPEEVGQYVFTSQEGGLVGALMSLRPKPKFIVRAKVDVPNEVDISHQVSVAIKPKIP